MAPPSRERFGSGDAIVRRDELDRRRAADVTSALAQDDQHGRRGEQRGDRAPRPEESRAALHSEAAEQRRLGRSRPGQARAARRNGSSASFAQRFSRTREAEGHSAAPPSVNAPVAKTFAPFLRLVVRHLRGHSRAEQIRESPPTHGYREARRRTCGRSRSRRTQSASLASIRSRRRPSQCRGIAAR